MAQLNWILWEEGLLTKAWAWCRESTRWFFVVMPESCSLRTRGAERRKQLPEPGKRGCVVRETVWRVHLHRSSDFQLRGIASQTSVILQRSQGDKCSNRTPLSLWFPARALLGIIQLDIRGSGSPPPRFSPYRLQYSRGIPRTRVKRRGNQKIRVILLSELGLV